MAIGLRHLPWLKQTDWLWDRLRPGYNRLIHRLAPNGIERVMNGTDALRLVPEQRGVPEIYEPEIWKIVMAALRPGARVIEAGAHIGLYAVAMAKRVGSTGLILAAEPDPENQAVLRQHIALNGVGRQVQVIPAGLSDQAGQACLHLQGIQSQLRPAEMTDHGTQVEITTIDAIAGREPVDSKRHAKRHWIAVASGTSEMIDSDVYGQPVDHFEARHPWPDSDAGGAP